MMAPGKRPQDELTTEEASPRVAGKEARQKETSPRTEERMELDPRMMFLRIQE